MRADTLDSKEYGDSCQIWYLFDPSYPLKTHPHRQNVRPKGYNFCPEPVEGNRGVSLYKLENYDIFSVYIMDKNCTPLYHDS